MVVQRARQLCCLDGPELSVQTLKFFHSSAWNSRIWHFHLNNTLLPRRNVWSLVFATSRPEWMKLTCQFRRFLARTFRPVIAYCRVQEPCRGDRVRFFQKLIFYMVPRPKLMFLCRISRAFRCRNCFLICRVWHRGFYPPNVHFVPFVIYMRARFLQKLKCYRLPRPKLTYFV